MTMAGGVGGWLERWTIYIYIYLGIELMGSCFCGVNTGLIKSFDEGGITGRTVIINDNLTSFDSNCF